MAPVPAPPAANLVLAVSSCLCPPGWRRDAGRRRRLGAPPSIRQPARRPSRKRPVASPLPEVHGHGCAIVGRLSVQQAPGPIPLVTFGRAAQQAPAGNGACVRQRVSNGTVGAAAVHPSLAHTARLGPGQSSAGKVAERHAGKGRAEMGLLSPRPMPGPAGVSRHGGEGWRPGGGGGGGTPGELGTHQLHASTLFAEPSEFTPGLQP